MLEPAIGYAESGYPLVPGICADIARMEQVFRDEWPASAELYLPVPKPGTLFRNRDLAATYRRVLAESGRPRASFYEGFVAEAIDDFSREHGSLLDRRRPRLVARLGRAAGHAPLRGLGRHKTGPWGQGPVFLQQLALLEGFELGDREGPDFVHTVVECAKLAFADREAWYGDGDVPLDDLLSAGLRGRAAQARRRRGLGRAAARQPGRPRAAAPAHPGGARPSPAPASRPAATPATSTWSTASATPSRPRPAAAGCTARR